MAKKDKGKDKAKSKSRLNYFVAFQRQIDYAMQEADLLVEVVDTFTTADAVADVLPRAHEIESAADEVRREIMHAIDIDFLTPIDREDIIIVANELDDIVDTLEDLIQRFYIFNIDEMHDNAKPLVEGIRMAVGAVAKAAENFSGFKKPDKFRETLIEVDEVEEEVDRLYAQIMHELYSTYADNPLHILQWTQIFELMEECVDKCDDLAEVMDSVILKNS